MRHVLLIFSSTARSAPSSIYIMIAKRNSINYGHWARSFVVKVRPRKNLPNTIAQAFSGKCKTKYKVKDAYGALKDKIVKFNELWVQVKTKFVRKLQYCFCRHFRRIYLKIFFYFFLSIIMTSPIVSQTNPWD